MLKKEAGKAKEKIFLMKSSTFARKS